MPQTTDVLKLNGPTQLTVMRIAIIPLVIVFNYMSPPWSTWVSLGVFLLASLTDWLDGYLARKRNQITTFGKLLDPLADKLLVLTAFLVILERQHIEAWVAIFMIGREMGVTGLRAFLAAERIVLPAGALGKWKMVLQIIALSSLFVAGEHPYFLIVGRYVLYVALVFSLVSAYFYITRFWNLLGEKILAEQKQSGKGADDHSF
ncbi:MAG: CDP-diacylglycerol--glycerol-3-phosphate 3-phosphatidyltransferase [Acidobacteriota bacterium]|nr:CDP-diacylglycerol--glycerol-3-phosphate 3-phosphatidyltransferase [Acidobacteriota bacterium]